MKIKQAAACPGLRDRCAPAGRTCRKHGWAVLMGLRPGLASLANSQLPPGPRLLGSEVPPNHPSAFTRVVPRGGDKAAESFGGCPCQEDQPVICLPSSSLSKAQNSPALARLLRGVMPVCVDDTLPLIALEDIPRRVGCLLYLSATCCHVGAGQLCCVLRRQMLFLPQRDLLRHSSFLS